MLRVLGGRGRVLGLGLLVERRGGGGVRLLVGVTVRVRLGLVGIGLVRLWFVRVGLVGVPVRGWLPVGLLVRGGGVGGGKPEEARQEQEGLKKEK